MTIVTKPAVATVTAAQAIVNFRNNKAIAAQTIVDTSADIVASLDQLQTLAVAGNIASIALTTTQALSMTAASFVADTRVLAAITTAYTVIVSLAPAASAAALQAAAHVSQFSVADTAANIVANLGTLNTSTRMSSIAITNLTALALTYTQYAANTAALGRLAAGSMITVGNALASAAAGLQANAHVASFAVSDTAANVMANLATLNTAARLSSITIINPARLTLAYTQYAANAFALGHLTAGSMMTVGNAAAAAAATLQANANVAAFTVADSAANVVTNLTALTAATKLQTIVVSDQATLIVTLSQFTGGGIALAKISSVYVLIVSNVTAATASGVQTNSHVKSFAVSDTAVNVFSSLDALNGYTKLTAIALTNNVPLSIAFAQYSNDSSALGKITGAWSVGVSGVSAAAAANVQANAHVTSFNVYDTAASVAANLDALNGDSKLTSILISGGGQLSLTAHQIVTDTAALGKIGALYQIAASGVLVANLTAVQSNPHVVSIHVADTSANILAALGTLNSDSIVTSISLSDGNILGVTFAQYGANGAVFNKLASPDLVSVTGVTAAAARNVQADGHVASFGVADTAANIVTNLDALNGDWKLSSIAITGTSALSLSYAQFNNDQGALGRLTGTFTLAVSNVTAAGAPSVAANTHVTHFTVSDALGLIGSKLDQLEAAVKTGKLTAINVTDTGNSLTLTQAQYTADADAIALMHGSYTIYHPAPVSGATINLVWDAKALAAPAAFRSAMTYAAQYIQSLIANPVTINIAVGYGEVGGSALGSGVLGAAGPTQGIGQSYAQFKGELSSRGLVTNLPSADPTNGGTIYVASAEEKALGLMSATNTAIDGTMGFAADPNGTLFTYDPNNRGVQGKYDLIGVAEHEITHALGRIALGGTYGNWISALDLFRYSAPGAHSPNAGGAAYFSLNNGVTNLDWFSGSSDLADWASTAGNDANDAYSNGGVVNQFTATDIAELNALGYATSGSPGASAAVQTTVLASSGLNAPALTFMGTPTLTFMSDDMPIISADLNGVEEIAQFAYGLNELQIDLGGAAPSALVAFDTTVEGQHAIALANAADTSHGVILTNMAANNTAAGLMASHLSFANGQAIVT